MISLGGARPNLLVDLICRCYIHAYGSYIRYSVAKVPRPLPTEWDPKHGKTHQRETAGGGSVQRLRPEPEAGIEEGGQRHSYTGHFRASDHRCGTFFDTTEIRSFALR